MNCKSCNASNNYLFATNCVQCGCEIQPASIPRSNPFQDLQSSESRLTGLQKLINLVYILAGSMAGMISGGVIFYFSFVVVYLALFSGGDNRGNLSCGGWDDFILILMILVGAYLGIVGGTALALKKPLCKVAAK